MSENTEKKKILLVDDEKSSISIAEVMLSDNYSVASADTCNKALKLIINDFIPDLILLDILMPDTDGWETFNTLKGVSLLRGVPIAFLTSVDNPEAAKRARELGAADYIMKPYNKADLLSRIGKILDIQK